VSYRNDVRLDARSGTRAVHGGSETGNGKATDDTDYSNVPGGPTPHALRKNSSAMNEGDGQLHTLSVLEQLREASKGLWGASSAAYFRVDELLRQLANPNLHDIPRNLPFRVEM
jgi:hypothetical protein